MTERDRGGENRQTEGYVEGKGEQERERERERDRERAPVQVSDLFNLQTLS